jgi:hypothetical protein
MNIDDYLNSWITYYVDCTLRVKGRAKLNNDAKRKLRQYHFERYIDAHKEAVPFVLTMKFRHPSLYKQIPCFNQIYRVALKKRQEYFDEGKHE